MTKVNERIEQLILEQNLNKPLVITIGFDVNDLNHWLIEPIAQKLDITDIEAKKTKLISEAFSNIDKFDDYLMVRPEEFSLLRDAMDVEMIYHTDIVVLKNNLFDKSFPYSNTLSDVDKAYEMLYLSEDIELEGLDKKRVERINIFYGSINFSKNSKKYFITYKEDLWDKYPKYDFYRINGDTKVITVDVPKASINVALDEEETRFLDFELGHDFLEPVNFVVDSVDHVPHKYLERIAVLKMLNPELVVTFSTQSIKREQIKHLNEYRNILKRVWDYDDFRDLNMYANIEKRDKKLIKISQAQIIDDIVNQAENARKNEEYRDIYITASTGAGKSVMFQIPTLYLTEKYVDDKPLILVISPLIGLMNDQVDSMKSKGVNNAETINGNTPPYEKQNILHKVADGSIDMLYLSPETLQARGDIKMLIGNRKIGMLIVDEAHIVTTWGKSFRADYWYLGIYLQKLRKEYQFPIVTFTATAIYGGSEDMYLDARDSLNMIRPIAYFGLVRRNDISMKIRSGLVDEGDKDYRKKKSVLAFNHLKDAFEKKQKSLVYFPTVRLLNEFFRFLEVNYENIANVTGKYYGSLDKEEKDTVLEEFKSGEIRFVLATKAFGMGIDIPDITNVYHYNPTGNVVDYVQEIGRVARDHSLVPKGFGILDYLPRDFNAVQQLQGMSAIKTTQIQGVMKKILDIYRVKGSNRNLVVSADDFKYIFSDNLDDDNNNLDNKVKTVLLMIEKDFSSDRKLGYSPFVARPRSVFGKELIIVSRNTQTVLVRSALKDYFEVITSLKGEGYSTVLSVDLSGIWEKYYKKISFPEFKYKINTLEERKKMDHAKIFELFNFASGIQYTFDEDNDSRLAGYKKVMETYQSFLDSMQREAKQFEVRELGSYIRSSLNVNDEFKARSLAQVLINATFEYQKLKNVKILRERPGASKTLFATVKSGEMFGEFINQIATRLYTPIYSFSKGNNKMRVFHNRNSDNFDEEIITLGIGEAFDQTIGLNFTTLGGYNPQIYVRINSVYPVEQAIKQDKRYRNFILQDVLQKHKIGVVMQKFLFTHKEKDINEYTNWFWNQIEDYFMGRLPIEVEQKLNSKRK
ncbi:helicase-related protein [Pediococcus stilesii]|uniref:DNA 3'-5' helicase n=1 Tax=Pediococcus stilesii TaxID=331679 RepID=A0A0R2KZH4_9LACO|nr:helicase-related protein [Pediococcus stilesii]KRN93013.1 ATP-dependent DNA helicase [Pediococcus stilesii]